MTDDVDVFHIIVRRINRYAMKLTIPKRYIREHGIREGDHCVWIPEPDGVRLKFVKTTEPAETEGAR